MIAAGTSHEEQRTFSQSEVDAFSELSGDRNTLHRAGESSYGLFDGPVVHGALLVATFSKILGMELPGPGTIFLQFDLQFQRPLYVGRPAIFRVTVERRHETKPIYWLRTVCLESQGSSEGRVICEGSATVRASE